MHLAHLDSELRAWVTWCDYIVVHDDKTAVHEYDYIHGITQKTINQIDGIVRDHGHLCANCRRFVMLMKLMQHDRMHGLAFQYTFAA